MGPVRWVEQGRSQGGVGPVRLLGQGRGQGGVDVVDPLRLMGHGRGGIGSLRWVASVVGQSPSREER